MMTDMRLPAAIFLCGISLWGSDADLILYHGKIVTLDGKSSISSAVAIKGGRIISVGSDADVRKNEAGPHTNQIDLQGKCVLPGLIDNHVHVLSAGLSEYRGEIPSLASYADIQSYIRMKAKTTPKGKWIVVPRTFPTRLREMRMPTRDVLDVDPDHPVLFDASYVWILNSLGLKMNGITRDTPNPPRGEIVKDAKGEPNGILRNAESLVKGVNTGDTFTPQEKLDALEKMLKRYPAIGLTTVGDRAVQEEDVDLYHQLKAAKGLPIRVVLTWRMPTAGSVDQLVRNIHDKSWVTNQGDEWLKFGAFKVTLDGGMTIGTAYQRQPYGAFARQLYGLTDPSDRGQLFVPPDKLLVIMRAARDKGWALTAHAQGGGAVDTLLETFEKLNAEKPLAPSRSHWIHASFQSPDAIARAKKIGMLADVQSAWLYFDGPALEKVFGHEGMRYFFPLRSYLNAGVVIAGGSDHMIGFSYERAVNSYNPFLGMWIAVTRKMHNGEVLYPEERITREEALRMYTTGPAYMQFNEKDRGSIESGKLGDLVVIDRDYFKCPEDEIRQIRPVMTIINGRIAYSVSHTSASLRRRMLQSQHPGMPTNANHESGVTAYARGAAQERLF
jgi:predicted amidohydrolase YtcJ